MQEKGRYHKTSRSQTDFPIWLGNQGHLSEG